MKKKPQRVPDFSTRRPVKPGTASPQQPAAGVHPQPVAKVKPPSTSAKSGHRGS